METKDNSLESSIISALLSYSRTALQTQIKDTLPKFSSPLKTNFENRNLWLRFGLVLSLSHQAPRSALQAFNECLRIDQYDPLPAMLAAKLLLEDLDDPESGLELVNQAIERCQRLMSPSSSEEKSDDSGMVSSILIQNGNGDDNPEITKAIVSSDHYLETKCCYKNITPILSKCYLLASIMHAYIYEREPESIKQYKTLNQKASLDYIDLAIKTNSNDHLIYFHKALHEAKQRSYSSSIDNARHAIKLNPHHVPSMQLLIISLSALKCYDEALLICESTLYEFEDDLLLLYIKCNLEQCLIETKGYKSALDTAQHMLRCIRRSSEAKPSNLNQPSETKQTTNLFAENNNNSRSKNDPVSGELSVWLLVAEIFLKIGSINDAELCVDEGATHIDGAFSYKIMFTRGLIAKEKNNLIEAKSFLQSCLALYPRHAKALQQMAHVHYLMGNYSTAEKFLRDSLDVERDCDKTWYYLSLVFIETNQHDKAKEAKEEARMLEESSPIIPLSVIPRLTLE